ncbi:Ribosomal protein L7/L12 [Vigna unguiculata]|uniref:Ribosomal protein L7/L12 n=1 Tax=Vigna unguiculata TaxID=3917 RepID=A0A4D6L5D8_VIGUN|nr:Ribosomal protein L7/L12 [Vigna unguiculata]
MVRSDTLVQASLSRLGETCRNRLGSHSSSRSGGELSFERVGRRNDRTHRQKQACGLHNLCAPWLPSTMEKKTFKSVIEEVLRNARMVVIKAVRALISKALKEAK